nr:MAG TPA: protein of unknown function (DUF4373) [Caudoviricetes sp.]
MARPARKGLAYFPKDVDFYQDEKIVDLALKYGPLGLTVFDVLLTLVYREGYYLELPLSKVGQLIVRTVGESWFRKTGMSATDLSVEVILYCAEIGLINAPLVRQNVITSVAIQTRYAAVTRRNKVNLTKYWLLDNRKVDGALESAPKNTVSVTETPVSVAETRVSVAEMPQSKVNKRKENISTVSAGVSVTETPELSTVSTGTDDTDGKVGFIIEEYRRLLPSLPPPEKDAKLMVNLFKADRPLADYTAVFERAASSRFLSEPKSGWRCTIGWLTDPANMDKVLAGKYDDYKKPRSRKENQTIGDAESGFDTEEFFQAALRRGMKGMKNDGEPESQ